MEERVDLCEFLVCGLLTAGRFVVYGLLAAGRLIVFAPHPFFIKFNRPYLINRLTKLHNLHSPFFILHNCCPPKYVKSFICRYHLTPTPLLEERGQSPPGKRL